MNIFQKGIYYYKKKKKGFILEERIYPHWSKFFPKSSAPDKKGERDNLI